MKNLTTFIAVLAIGIFASLAETPSQPQRPVRTESQRQITLSRAQSTSRINRAPAMPIFGYYDGSTLSIAFNVVDDNETLSVNLHCDNGAVHEETCTANELQQGIIISVYEPFWVEIITASGAVYCEPHEDNE